MTSNRFPESTKPAPGIIGLLGMGPRLSSTERYVSPALLDCALLMSQLLTPICGAREHDSIALYVGLANDSTELPDPPATEVVNAALKLFAICLPLQTPKIQESILEQMTSFLSASSLQRDTNRKTAMMVNMACALLCALKVAAKETRAAAGSLKGLAVEKVMQDLLHVCTCLVSTRTISNLSRSSLSCQIRTCVTLPERHLAVCAAGLETH
jgi:hypothetical protein